MLIFFRVSSMLMIGYVLIIAGLPKGRDVCWSVRSPSVVCAVVISRKLSKIDANTIRKLPLFILSLHSNLLPDAPPQGTGQSPPSWGRTIDPSPPVWKISTRPRRQRSKWFVWIGAAGGLAFYRTGDILIWLFLQTEASVAADYLPWSPAQYFLCFYYCIMQIIINVYSN